MCWNGTAPIASKNCCIACQPPQGATAAAFSVHAGCGQGAVVQAKRSCHRLHAALTRYPTFWGSQCAPLHHRQRRQEDTHSRHSRAAEARHDVIAHAFSGVLRASRRAQGTALTVREDDGGTKHRGQPAGALVMRLELHRQKSW